MAPAEKGRAGGDVVKVASNNPSQAITAERKAGSMLSDYGLTELVKWGVLLTLPEVSAIKPCTNVCLGLAILGNNLVQSWE